MIKYKRVTENEKEEDEESKTTSIKKSHFSVMVAKIFFLKKKTSLEGKIFLHLLLFWKNKIYFFYPLSPALPCRDNKLRPNVLASKSRKSEMTKKKKEK